MYRHHTAHRAELAGIIGGLTVLQLLHKLYPDLRGTLTIGLDGENALRRAKEQEESANFADWDLIKVVHSLIKELPFSFQWKWIKGHQDKEKEWNELDNWAKRNVTMDSIAKQ